MEVQPMFSFHLLLSRKYGSAGRSSLPLPQVYSFHLLFSRKYGGVGRSSLPPTIGV